ncbi:hypothetical protein GW17_00004748 [Ensete ventricosum]|nr:hypothetical protein GW17_00004748 [Ensete ventricosum]
MQTHTSAREQQLIPRARNSVRSSHRDSPSEEDRADEEASRTALSSFRMKEEQIERKKMEVREKVFAQLGRVEEESKRLAVIRKWRSHSIFFVRCGGGGQSWPSKWVKISGRCYRETLYWVLNLTKREVKWTRALSSGNTDIGAYLRDVHECSCCILIEIFWMSL